MPDAVAVLEAGAILNPRDTIAAATAAGLELAVMCAKLNRESRVKVNGRVASGQNVIGHDRVPDGGIYVQGGDAGNRAVTVAYLAFAAEGERLTPKVRRRQGWGPSQLTYGPLQLRAEQLGGLNVPRWNLQVGAEEMSRAIRTSGSLRDGAAIYNGGKPYAQAVPQAQEYARWIEEQVDTWRRLLAGVTADVPAAWLQLGSSGPDVVKLQRVLTAWYQRTQPRPDWWPLADDGQFGANTERAVRYMQARAGLVVDGIAGTTTRRQLGV